MLTVKRHKTFLKDLQRVRLSDKHFSRFILYVAKLIEQTPLPAEARNHPLKGDYAGHHEFHISGDVLVIYKISGDELWLLRLGSHSELFSK